MPSLQAIWQVRRWGTLFTRALHSKQIPMPQSAERGAPVIDVRHGTPASSIAAATVVPAATRRRVPLIETETESGRDSLHVGQQARGQVGTRINR